MKISTCCGVAPTRDIPQELGFCPDCREHCDFEDVCPECLDRTSECSCTRFTDGEIVHTEDGIITNDLITKTAMAFLVVSVLMFSLGFYVAAALAAAEVTR